MVKRLLVLILLLFFQGLFNSCEEEEVFAPKTYPQVRTLQISNVTSSGAIFTAEIISLGTEETLEYGFVWDQTNEPTVEKSDKTVFEKDASTGKYSAVISSSLEKGVKYYVRAYLRSNLNIYYGDAVSFVSQGSNAPEISGFAPLSAAYGDTVIISGTKFSFVKDKNVVKFDAEKAPVINSSDTTITILVPKTLQSIKSTLSVEIVGNKATGPQVFTLLGYEINLVIPTEGKSGDTVLVNGKNYDQFAGVMKVKFGEKQGHIIYESAEVLKVIVPNAVGNADKIHVLGGPFLEEIDFNYLKPEVLDFSPAIYTWGDTVTCSVRNFYSDNDLHVVTIGGKRAQIVESGNSILKIIVPQNLDIVSGYIDVEIAGYNLRFPDKYNLAPPSISQFPDVVIVGNEIIVNGNYFHPSQNTVLLNNTIQPELIHSSSTQIRFRLSEWFSNSQNTNGDQLEIKIKPLNIMEATVNTIIKTPILNSITLEGQNMLMSLYGQNFGHNPTVQLTNIRYLFNAGHIQNFPDFTASIIEATDTKITFELPATFSEPTYSHNLVADIEITAFNRTRISAQEILRTVTLGTFVRDNGIFDNSSYVFKMRLAYQYWDDENYGYVAGGRGKLIYSIVIPHGQEKFNHFYRFDPSDNSWTRLANWPQADNQDELIFSFSYMGEQYVINEQNKMFRYNSTGWHYLYDIYPDKFQLFFTIGNQPYMIANDYINKFNMETGKMENVLKLPYVAKCLTGYFNYEGNFRLRFCIGEEYTFNPNDNTLQLTHPRTNDTRVVTTEGKYITYNKYGIYSYNPSSGQEVLLDYFPDYGYDNFTPFRLFSINGVVYFRVAPYTILSYDIN